MANDRQSDNDQQHVAVTFCETVHGRRLGRDFTRLMERWAQFPQVRSCELVARRGMSVGDGPRLHVGFKLRRIPAP